MVSGRTLYSVTLLVILLVGWWCVPRQTGFPFAGADMSMLKWLRAPSGRGPLLR